MKVKVAMVIIPPTVIFEPMSWNNLMYKTLMWVLILFGYEVNCEGSCLSAWYHHLVGSARYLQCQHLSGCLHKQSSDAPSLSKCSLIKHELEKYCESYDYKRFHRKNINFSSNNWIIERRSNNLYNLNWLAKF